MKKVKKSFVLSVIKSAEVRKGILERCGENPVADGLQCPHCGAFETYKSATDPDNVDKWWFVIRAFRVDDASECCNCKKWFDLSM